MVKIGRHATVVAVWAKFYLLPAKCSSKWPHEKNIRILPKYFMGEVPKICSIHQYPLFAKWLLFVEIPKCGDLGSVYLLQLWQIILNDRKRIRPSDQHESCSLLCAL